MRRIAFAEWLLRQFMEQARAMSIVGDLAEVAGEKGAAWFWSSYAGVLASVAWRPACGFALAAAAAWFGGRYYIGSGGLGILIYLYAPSGLPTVLMRVVNHTGDFSAFIFFFAAVRFGLNDRLTRLALGFAVLGLTVDWFSFVNYMPAIAVAAVAVLFVYGLMSQKGRQSLTSITVLWIAFAALHYIALKIFRAGIDDVLGFRRASAVYASWFYFCYIGAMALACFLCSRVHRAVIGNGELVRA